MGRNIPHHFSFNLSAHSLSPFILTLRLRGRLQCRQLCFSLRTNHDIDGFGTNRSEEHTSELQSRENLVCRLLLEKKKIPTRCTEQRCKSQRPDSLLFKSVTHK